LLQVERRKLQVGKIIYGKIMDTFTQEERNRIVFGEMILRESVSMVELQTQKFRQI